MLRPLAGARFHLSTVLLDEEGFVDLNYTCELGDCYVRPWGSRFFFTVAVAEGCSLNSLKGVNILREL